MADREGSRFTAGGGNRLGIVRYGREEMTQYERTADPSGSNILPGDALMATTDGNGNPVFAHHDGTATKDVYVAVEARGRGMDAQTDTGYVAGEDSVKAVRASGGGLHLRLAAGETVTDGDPLVVNGAADGTWAAESGEGAVAVEAHASEDLDLSGASEPELLKTEVE